MFFLSTELGTCTMIMMPCSPMLFPNYNFEMGSKFSHLLYTVQKFQRDRY